MKDVQAVEFRLVWWPVGLTRKTTPHCREVSFDALVVRRKQGYEVHNITAQERFPEMRTPGIRRFLAALRRALENTLGAPVVGLSPDIVDWGMMEGQR